MSQKFAIDKFVVKTFVKLLRFFLNFLFATILWLLSSLSLYSPQAELMSRAEGMVKETSEYRCLQSQFSVLYNESLILKAQLDETRARLNTTRTARLRQLEHMEVSCVCLCLCRSPSVSFPSYSYFPPCVQNDEVALQRKVRTEVFQLEDTLAQVRKEYEMLRIEFEQTLAANEQAGNLTGSGL